MNLLAFYISFSIKHLPNFPKHHLTIFFNILQFAILLLAAVAFAEPEAKPEAEADPALLYSSYYGYPYAHSGYYGYGGYGSYYGGYPYSSYYGGYGGYYGSPYAGYRLWKRDAEAKPEAEAEADPAVLYSSAYAHHAYPYANYAYGYPYAYAAHTYAAPAVTTHAVATPAVTYAAPAHTYAAPAHVSYVKPYSYYANSGGAVHIVKRDAEPKADADAQYYYNRYYGYGGYRYGGYGGYYGYPGYGYYGYGK